MNDASDSSKIRVIGLATAVAIVVANMVGTGVFTSLGFQVETIPSGFPIVLLWLIGGVIAFCGAVCYAELGAMMPRSGGEYHLLRSSLHPLIGFLSGWISVFVGFAAPIAVAAIAFGTYFSGALEFGNEKILAAIVVLAVALVHLGDLRNTGRFQLAFTAFKILLLLVLIVAGFLSPHREPVSFTPQPGDGKYIFHGSFAIALFWVMYSYSGWNAAAYMVGEIRQPGKNLPIALMAGTAAVTIIYVAVNMAFLRVTPIAEMSGQKDVARLAAGHMFGENGGSFMGFLICFGLISTISAMTWAGPRVTQVIGEDYRIFSWFGVKNRHGVPARAIVVQTLVVLALVTTRFEQLVLYIQSLLTLSSLLVMIALIWMRIKEPDAERPFRAWGYPVTPLVFIGMSGYMLWHQAFQKQAEMIAAGATLIVGIVLFLVMQKVDPPSKTIRRE